MKEMCGKVAAGTASVEQLQELLGGKCAGCAAGTIARLRSSEVCRHQKTQEWKKRRRSMVTASQAASVIKQNPYETPRALLMKKLNITSFKGNKFTRHGEMMEDAALDRYRVETGHELESFGLLVHPTEPWLGGSPDGITKCGRLVEVIICCPAPRMPSTKGCSKAGSYLARRKKGKGSSKGGSKAGSYLRRCKRRKGTRRSLRLATKGKASYKGGGLFSKGSFLGLKKKHFKKLALGLGGRVHHVH